MPGNAYLGRAYDFFPDGRILVQLSAPLREIGVVLNWHREVAEKLTARAR